MGVTGANLGLYEPDNGEHQWGTDVTNNFVTLDSVLGGDSALNNMTVISLTAVAITASSLTITGTSVCITAGSMTFKSSDLYFE